MIEAQGLRKCYGTLVAVDNLSLTIHEGECFGLLGPNGAGKTTTMHMLVGAHAPDSGRITVAGGGSPDEPEVRRRIGIAPQSLGIYEEMTGEENIAFFARMYGISGAAVGERTRAALAFTGLEEKSGARASTYSGGMKRRLNLACSIVHQPRLLLLDEPTVGVDPQSRNLIFEKIEELKANGTTIIYTTHYMEEAERLCDRVAIMDAGRVMACDTVSGLLRAHGGRSLVEVDYASPPDDRAAAGGEWNGNTLRIRTDAPLMVVTELAALGGEIGSLRINGGTMESVFLNLTGKKLRDE